MHGGTGAKAVRSLRMAASARAEIALQHQHKQQQHHRSRDRLSSTSDASVSDDDGGAGAEVAVAPLSVDAPAVDITANAPLVPSPDAAAGHTGSGYDDGVAWPNATALVRSAQRRIAHGSGAGVVGGSHVPAAAPRYETTSAAYRSGTTSGSSPYAARTAAQQAESTRRKRRGLALAASSSVPAIGRRRGRADPASWRDVRSPRRVAPSASAGALHRGSSGGGGGGGGGVKSGSSRLAQELARERELDHLLSQLEESRLTETKVSVWLCVWLCVTVRVSVSACLCV